MYERTNVLKCIKIKYILALYFNALIQIYKIHLLLHTFKQLLLKLKVFRVLLRVSLLNRLVNMFFLEVVFVALFYCKHFSNVLSF